MKLSQNVWFSCVNLFFAGSIIILRRLKEGGDEFYGIFCNESGRILFFFNRCQRDRAFKRDVSWLSDICKVNHGGRGEGGICSSEERKTANLQRILRGKGHVFPPLAHTQSKDVQGVQESSHTDLTLHKGVSRWMCRVINSSICSMHRQWDTLWFCGALS